MPPSVVRSKPAREPPEKPYELVRADARDQGVVGAVGWIEHPGRRSTSSSEHRLRRPRRRAGGGVGGLKMPPLTAPTQMMSALVGWATTASMAPGDRTVGDVLRLALDCGRRPLLHPQRGGQRRRRHKTDREHGGRERHVHEAVGFFSSVLQPSGVPGTGRSIQVSDPKFGVLARRGAHSVRLHLRIQGGLCPLKEVSRRARSQTTDPLPRRTAWILCGSFCHSPLHAVAVGSGLIEDGLAEHVKRVRGIVGDAPVRAARHSRERRSTTRTPGSRRSRPARR